MITDEQLERALQYLGAGEEEDPHPIALARYNLIKAENLRKEVGARVTLKVEGTVLEKEAQVEIDASYVAAKNTEASAELEFRRHEARCEYAKTLIDLWRTQQANARAMEQVR